MKNKILNINAEDFLKEFLQVNSSSKSNLKNIQQFISKDSVIKTSDLLDLGKLQSVEKVRNNENNLEIIFLDDKNHVCQIKIAREGENFRILSLEGACPVCFGSGYNEHVECAFCEKGWL